MSTNLRDPRLYVLWWLSMKGIAITPSGALVEPDSTRNKQDIFDSMWLDFVSQVKAYNAAEHQKPAAQRSIVHLSPEKDLQKALDELVAKEKSTHRATTIKALSCTGENLQPIEKFLTALTGHADPLEVAVIAHWVWLAKRKMSGLPVAHHLMPIFRGIQGAGKSVAARKVFEPIKDYQRNMSFTQMNDERCALALSENYVIFLDELEGVERADMSTIKRLLTAEYVDYRPMRSNGILTIKNNVSFLGCTNVPTAELLADRTGMRRFIEIVTLDRCDWATINAIDFTALWRGVDESKADGYVTPFLPALAIKQQELTLENEFATFISELNLLPTAESGMVEVPFERVYVLYRQWCDRNGYKPLSANWAGRKLSSQGLVSKQKWVLGKNMKVSEVNPAIQNLTYDSAGWPSVSKAI